MAEKFRDNRGRFCTAQKFAEALKQPVTDEVASAGSAILNRFMNFSRFNNPDDLVRQKGISIYQQMSEREPYIKAALMQKKTSLLSVDWDIDPASNRPEDIKVADFVRWNLKEFLESSFSYDIYEALDALDIGFSLLEKLMTIVPDGPWKGKWAYRKFKSKNPKHFEFKLDEFDNILALQMTSTLGELKTLDIDKFFHFAFNKRYENPYGQSDLRPVYRAFWLKDTAWKLRAIYMERYAGNNLKGTYPSGDALAKQALLDIFRSWQQESGIAIPKGTEVDVLNLATGSVSEYERAISDLNKEILIGILGVTLTVDEGKKTGARAMGQVHKEVADLFVLFLDIQLTSEINRQIIKPLVDWNFPDVFTYPRFTFEKRGAMNSQDILMLKQAGVPVPDDFVFRKFNIKSEPGALSSPPQGQDPVTQDDLSEFREQITESVNSAVQKFADLTGPDRPAGRIIPEKEELIPGQFWRPLNKAEKFAEIPRVDASLFIVETAAVQASRPAYEEIFKSISRYVIRNGILTKNDRSASIRLAAKVPVDVGALKNLLSNSMLTTDLMGRSDQAIEMQNQAFDFTKVKKFREMGIDKDIIKLAEVGIDSEVIDKPLNPDEIRKVFSGRIPMTKAQFTELVKVKNSEAFYIAGLEQGVIEHDVQPLIVQAINEGWSEDEFLFNLRQQFTKYVTPDFANVGATSAKLLDFHAQTVFRNAMMSSYNEARTNFRNEPELIEAFPGSLYSAILDNRTSSICKALDGKQFLATDPAWIPYYPQNHHRCRSMLISINKFDFNPDNIDPAPTGVIIPVGFGGQ